MQKETQRSEQKLNEKNIIELFNNNNTSAEQKQYYKTIILNALTSFAEKYAGVSSVESMMNELRELTKAEDGELYRVSVSALAKAVASSALSPVKSLQMLTYILRHPPKNVSGEACKLKESEIKNLLTIILLKISTDAVTLDALNNLLDTIIDTQTKLDTFEEKKAIKEQLEEIKGKTKSDKDYLANFHANVALKTLEKVKVDESQVEEWKRRALAFASAAESIIKIASDITGAVASFGATAIFILPGIIEQATNAIKQLYQAFNFELSKNEWYAKIKDVQAALTLAAVEKSDKLQNVLMKSDLDSLFNGIQSALAKKKLPSGVQYAIVESMEKVLLMRDNEEVLNLALRLLKVVYTNSHKASKPDIKKQAIASRIIEALLVFQKHSDKKAALSIELLKVLENEDPVFYGNCSATADRNLKERLKVNDNIPVLATLIPEAQHKLDQLIKNEVKTATSTPKDKSLSREELYMQPLFGDGTILKDDVKINEKFTGVKFTGTSVEIISLVNDANVMKILTEQCETARFAILRPLTGKNTIVEKKIDANRDIAAPEINTANTQLFQATRTKPSENEIRRLLFISDELENLIKSSTSKENDYRFLLKFPSRQVLIINCSESKETNGRKMMAQLSKLQEGLDLCLKNSGFKYNISDGENDKTIKIEAEQNVLNAVAELLVVQGMKRESGELTKLRDLFKNKKPEDEKQSESELEKYSISCCVQ
jgi:hypothetical protein